MAVSASTTETQTWGQDCCAVIKSLAFEHLFIATICCVSIGACGDRTLQGTVTGPRLADATGEAEGKGDCTGSCADLVEIIDTGPDGANSTEDIEAAPLPTGACPKLKAESLADVMPCQGKDTCCSTVMQYDPCATGSKLTSAPSRWQLFRFWTAESPACVDGKEVYFHLYPNEPWPGENFIDTMTWAPTCPGITTAMDWASIRFSDSGLEAAESSVTLMASPFKKNYNPCGLARVGQTKVVVLGCSQYSGGATQVPEFLTSLGNGSCCYPENALITFDSGAIKAVASPPKGFNRWGLPTPIPKSSIRTSQSLDIFVLAIDGKNLDLAWGEYGSDGYVKAMKVARLSTDENQLKIVSTLGSSKADYHIGDRKVAVLDDNHLAWTFDGYAPAPIKWILEGNDFLLALAMIVDGGTKEIELEGETGADGSYTTHVLASNGGYIVVAKRHMVRVDKHGNVMAAKEISIDASEFGLESRPIAAPDGGVFTASFRDDWKFNGVSPLARLIRLDPNGNQLWSWKMDDTLAFPHLSNLLYHNGVLHLFGILVPKTKDSTWAWHLRLDAATGKELCPGQMPAKP